LKAPRRGRRLQQAIRLHTWFAGGGRGPRPAGSLGHGPKQQAGEAFGGPGGAGGSRAAYGVGWLDDRGAGGVRAFQENVGRLPIGPPGFVGFRLIQPPTVVMGLAGAGTVFRGPHPRGARGVRVAFLRHLTGLRPGPGGGRVGGGKWVFLGGAVKSRGGGTRPGRGPAWPRGPQFGASGRGTGQFTLCTGGFAGPGIGRGGLFCAQNRALSPAGKKISTSAWLW